MKRFSRQPDATSPPGCVSVVWMAWLLILTAFLVPSLAFAHRAPIKGDILIFQRSLMPAANEQPQYDSRGNQTQDSLFDYEWDQADRLVSGMRDFHKTAPIIQSQISSGKHALRPPRRCTQRKVTMSQRVRIARPACQSP